MEANADECHLLTIPTDPTTIKIKSNEIINSDSEQLQGVAIYSKLNFSNHLQSTFKKANQKVYVLARITPDMSIPNGSYRWISFSYYNLIASVLWMCHSRLMYHIINRLPEKFLRIFYSDNTSSFEELLDKDGSVTTH